MADDADDTESSEPPTEQEYHDLDAFVDTLGLEEGITCADIGCGTPFYTLEAAQIVSPGRLYAVDIQSDRLDAIEGWAQEEGIGNIMPMRTGDRGIPVPDGSVDIAYCAGAFHEFEAPDTVLRDVLRMMKDDGTFFLIDWKATDSPGGPPLRHRAPLTTLLKALREVGFDQLKNHDVFEYFHCVQATK